MKRLLSVGMDTALSSITPIFIWFFLSFFLDKNIMNVFAITYPLQFIYAFLLSVFSTGANICYYKDHNKQAPINGMIIGTIVSFVIFFGFVLNIETYLSFMNVDIDLYKTFSIYAIVMLFYYFILGTSLNYLYFSGRNKQANTFSVSFNSISVITIMISVFLFENSTHIVIFNLVVLGVVSVLLFMITIKDMLKECSPYSRKLSILHCIQYDAVDIFSNFAFFLTYLFGSSNGFSYGSEYVTTLTFCSLITDTQWDVFGAIKTVAKIDIVKENFNYNEHLKHAYYLLGILLSSSAIMFILLHHYYELNYSFIIICFGLELMNFLNYPLYAIKTYIVQLKHSTKIITINKIISVIIRVCCSFIPVPSCTYLGQMISSLYQQITVKCIYSGYHIKELKEVDLSLQYE